MSPAFPVDEISCAALINTPGPPACSVLSSFPRRVLESESVEINGSVELVVARSVKGLRAKVTPNELRVDSLNSRAWLRKPFDAEIELDTLVAMPRSKVAHP